jgi:hypothetical protein
LLAGRLTSREHLSGVDISSQRVFELAPKVGKDDAVAQLIEPRLELLSRELSRPSAGLSTIDNLSERLEHIPGISLGHRTEVVTAIE